MTENQSTELDQTESSLIFVDFELLTTLSDNLMDIMEDDVLNIDLF